MENAYGVTSLTKSMGSPQRILELNRGHWEIENRLHYVRDVTYNEDQCRVRTQNGPRNMVTIRNVAISLARMMRYQCIAECNRILAFSRERMTLLGIA